MRLVEVWLRKPPKKTCLEGVDCKTECLGMIKEEKVGLTKNVVRWLEPIPIPLEKYCSKRPLTWRACLLLSYVGLWQLLMPEAMD